MRTGTPNISYTTKHDLCVGCGVCQDACPQRAITVINKDGLFRPEINDGKCVNSKGCHRCYDVCPGIGIEINAVAEKEFCDAEIRSDIYIGRYLNHYVGYSTDHELRYHCASGGLTSQFIIYLLDKGLITGAVVTRFDNDNPLMVQTFVARNKEEILSAKSSKYAPVTMAGIAEQIKSMNGKFVVVGLPCHIHGFRKLEKKDVKFKNKIFAYFGLYCSCGRKFHLTEYTLKAYNVSRKSLKSFAYRDNGCMGNLNIDFTNDDYSASEISNIQVPYEKYYLILRSFFNIHRCLFCIDHFAELADISFGDIHYGKYLNDKVGISSVVTRRTDLDKLVHEAMTEGVVSLEYVDKEDLLNSQKYSRVKKHLNPVYMRIYSVLGYKIPVYDAQYVMVPVIKSIKSLVIKKIQMSIGTHRSLWWIIDKVKNV